MLIPIRCFTCGKVLADKYDYYVREAEALKTNQPSSSKQAAATKKKSKKEADREPDQSQSPFFDVVKTGPLMEKMGVTRICCKRHLLTTVDMMDTI